MNKIVLLLIVFISFPVCLCAQDDYRPLITDGKYWKGKEIGMVAGMQFDYDFFLQGDTVINGVEYVKCYEMPTRGFDGAQAPDYYRALREEEHKVYCIPRGTEHEYLMFDFNLSVGDEVYCVISEANEPFLTKEMPEEKSLNLMILDKVDTYSYVGNVDIRRYHFTNWRREIQEDGSVVEVEGLPTVWAEGVGSLNDYPLKSWHLEMVSSYAYWLEKCYDINNTLYFSPPNYIGEMVKPSQCPKIIYDLQGRRQSTPPAKGVYIQNGKKYVR